MGYAFHAYAVDEDVIRDFWRSGKEEAVAGAMASSLGVFREERMPTIAEALRDIAIGTVPVGDQPDGARHVYATEILCAHWGRKVGDELRVSARALDEAPELAAFVRSAPSFYAIRPRDFPMMCGWSAKQVGRRLSATQSWPPRFEQEREIYEEWLRAAAELGVGLVAFYY